MFLIGCVSLPEVDQETVLEETPGRSPLSWVAVAAGLLGLASHVTFFTTLGGWRPSPTEIAVQTAALIAGPPLGIASIVLAVSVHRRAVKAEQPWDLVAIIGLALGVTTAVISLLWLALFLLLRVVLPCMEGSPYCPF